MNISFIILCLALVSLAAAKPGYNYPQPAKGLSNGSFKQQQQGFRPPQTASSSGIYSANLSEQIKQNIDISSTVLAAPSTTQNGLTASSSANLGLVAPSQFAQQFAAPSSQFVAPIQQQQQFASPTSQFIASVPLQQQFAGPTHQQQFAGTIQQQQPFLAPAPVAQYQPINFQQQPQQQTLISKDIYIHSAPEELEEIGNDRANVPAGPIRKNYRIVFIKAPTQNVKLNVDALKRSQASNEEKTVIYVLSKKPDLSEIQTQLSAVQNEQKAHKPEVFFIKYKTQEEANRAQQEIQAQYDSLGGSTHISDEGFAPVHSVIGGGSINVGNIGGGTRSNGFQGSTNFGQQQFVHQSYQSSQTTVGDLPTQKYLPVKKK